jgi:lipid-binding SYLF domain-containing protein
MTSSHESSCALGISIVDTLMGTVTEVDSRFEGKGLNPAFIASSNILIFLETTKIGLFLGTTGGRGFAIAKVGGSWSAPCHVTLRKFELGGIIGYSSSYTIISGISKRAIQEIIDDNYTEFGTDVTVQLWPKEAGVDDQVSVNSSDFVSASCSNGVLFDFSLSGGALRIDTKKNAEVYGEDVTASQLLNGVTPRPKEMVPLYHKIGAIAKSALN